MSTCNVIYDGTSLFETGETGNISIKYNDYEIYSVPSSTTGTLNLVLPCNGCYMAGDITVGSKKINCNGTTMKSDITITVVGSTGGSGGASNTYVIYQPGWSNLEYATYEDSSYHQAGDGNFGVTITDSYMESYSGSSSSSSSGIFGSTLSGAVGEGKLNITLDTETITDPGVLYISAYGNYYDGDKGAFSLDGTQYYVEYSWQLLVTNGDGTELLNVTPPTPETAYTYSCEITKEDISKGITISANTLLAGTAPVQLYITGIEYISNTTLNDSDDYIIFGDGRFREDVAWKARQGHAEEADCIIKLTYESGYTDNPVVTFINKDANGNNVGFDFSDYNTLNIQTERVVNVGSYSAFATYIESDVSGTGPVCFLTEHISGTIVDSFDISEQTGNKFINIKAYESAWISKVWLSK